VICNASMLRYHGRGMTSLLDAISFVPACAAHGLNLMSHVISIVGHSVPRGRSLDIRC
jgi:hypothetical protein